MLSNIKGIQGRYKEFPRSNSFMASPDESWTRTYYTIKEYIDRNRRKKNFNTDADWFLVMEDGTEYPLPSPEEMIELDEQLDTLTTEFWSKALNIPE